MNHKTGRPYDNPTSFEEIYFDFIFSYFIAFWTFTGKFLQKETGFPVSFSQYKPGQTEAAAAMIG